MQEQTLLKYYIKYLRDIRNLKESTVNHYTQALRTISGFLVDKNKITESLYEVQDLDELRIIKEYLYNDVEFIQLDKRGHQMYSAGLNNYYRFACGEGIKESERGIDVLDIELPAPEKLKKEIYVDKRSSIVKIQAIESARYECEFDTGHRTFISKSTNNPYMEGHHALPLKYQDRFKSRLDIYANIVCLCPTCHRLLHYGVESDKEIVLDKIYYDRADRLANCGIKISKSDFKTLVI